MRVCGRGWRERGRQDARRGRRGPGTVAPFLWGRRRQEERRLAVKTEQSSERYGKESGNRGREAKQTRVTRIRKREKETYASRDDDASAEEARSRAKEKRVSRRTRREGSLGLHLCASKENISKARDARNRKK